MKPARAVLALLSATAALVAGCRRDGCVGGDDGTCAPPSACGSLRYQCGDRPGSLRVTTLAAGDLPQRPDAKARATVGDVLLENDLVRVVVAAPSHAAGLAPTGGSIIDLAPKAAGSGDQINAIDQVAGLLPRDAVHYDGSPATITGGESAADSFVAVVLRGHLEGDSRVTVVTRYELRACEPGVRVRSDLYNGAADANTLYLADGLLWGDNAAAPFVPGVGLGFRAPTLDLRDVASAWGEWPFVAARTQAPPAASYAVVPCDRPQSAGFNDTTLSNAGVPLVTTLPGDGFHLERFIVAVAGQGLAPAVGEALRVRQMVHGETAPVTVSGRVVAGGLPFASQDGRAASLLFYEPAFGPDPDDPARRKPWSEAVPQADGTFSVVLPAGRGYRAQPYAFGLPSGPAIAFQVERDDANIGDITLTAPARLTATVSEVPGQPPTDPTYAELVLVPVMPPTGGDEPSFYGLWPGCSPMLGPPHGGSPACNRAFTTNGKFDLLIRPGQYRVYATRGPFETIDRVQITVEAGRETNVELVVQPLSLLPAGVFSGDFHVHGAASFDSSLPDRDRVGSFLAAGVDVVVASDHDVVTSYAGTLADLKAAGLLTVVPGIEQTPEIPWFAVPGQDLPKTLGHFNFWPLSPDPAQPRNGAPWDELREPGEMMDDIEPLFTGTGVRQLNHPYAESKLERDRGFLRAIGYDPRTPIASGAGFAADVLLRQPGALHRNSDWDLQEVMSGASPAEWLRSRALWFSLLSQGFHVAGTANSDSHSLALGQIGYPRNLVFEDSGTLTVDVEQFDDDVRRGHMVGTTGPVLQAAILDGFGNTRLPDLQPFQASRSQGQLRVDLAVAPWIPVNQLRVIVNGKLAPIKTMDDTLVRGPIDISGDFAGVNPRGTQPAIMKRRFFPLDTLLQEVKGDAWIVVEAGYSLPDPVDVDGDGLPDLTDGDRVPLGDAALADFQAIAPGAWPVAFTNPFRIYVDDDGWQPPGLTP